MTAGLLLTVLIGVVVFAIAGRLLHGAQPFDTERNRTDAEVRRAKRQLHRLERRATQAMHDEVIKHRMRNGGRS